MGDIPPIALSLITVSLIAFMLWFALGTQRNIRKGNSVLRWLQKGLPLLGRRTTVRWLGSSAVQLKIIEPLAPFREAEVVAVFEPRDLAWLWAWSRARGRRDFLVLRARLERSPAFELEAGELRGWTGQDRLRRLDVDAWQQADWGYETVKVAHGNDADVDGMRRMWRNLDANSGGVWRMSVRRDTPHVEIHVLFPDTTKVDAEPLFRTFRDAADAALRR